MSIDRAALIEAATHAIAADYGVSGDEAADEAESALDAVLLLIADAIEALDSDWHFRGPGDPGILVVSQAAAVELVRSLGGNDGSNE